MVKSSMPAGAVLFAQSGTPTTVANAALLAALTEAKRKAKVFHRLLGARNGLLGILQEELFDFAKEDPKALEALEICPALAAGSCPYPLRTEADLARAVEVFQAHNIRYFFPIGNRDAMNAADRIGRLAEQKGHELVVMGIPATAENNLAFTDHCPGFGSAARYNATTIMEASRDTESLYTAEAVTVQEIPGREAGWLTASCGLARRNEEDGPHLLLVPELPVNLNKFADLVRDGLKRLGRCVVVVGEGAVDESGRFLSEQALEPGRDVAGPGPSEGASEFLGHFIEREVGVKTRRNKPGSLLRSAMHWASRTDLDEAAKAGQMAVKHALQGSTGFMVTLVRKSGRPYKCDTGLAKLSEAASGESRLPRHFMNEAGTHIADPFREYCLPLIKGDVTIPLGKDGLPLYPRLQRKLIPRKCGEWKR